MLINVKTLKGSHFPVEVKPEDTVADVKKIIEEAQGSGVYPAAQQMLIHQGKVLKDETTMEENKVADKSFVVIMLTKSKATPSRATATPSNTISHSNFGSSLQETIALSISLYIQSFRVMRKGAKRKTTHKAEPKSKLVEDKKNENESPAEPAEESKPEESSGNAEPEPSKAAAGKGRRKRVKVAKPETELEFFPEKRNLVIISFGIRSREALQEGGELHNKKVYLFGCTKRGPKLRKWYGAPNLLEKDGNELDEDESPGVTLQYKITYMHRIFYVQYL